MSKSNTKVSIWGERTFHIDRVDCTVDVGTVTVSASFHDVTEEGTANGTLVWTDNAIIQKYIDDLPAGQGNYSDEDEAFMEAFKEAVEDMCGTVGPCVSVGPINGPSSCMSYVEGDK